MYSSPLYLTILLPFLQSSYEALPSNYGLGRNMLAGAFAGIAVWSIPQLSFFSMQSKPEGAG